MTHSPAPSRSTGKLVIQFGIISVPVDVFNGVNEDANKITRTQRSVGSGAPVKYVKTDSETGEILDASGIKMVTVLEDGTEVELTDEEIDAAQGLENGSCELLGFYSTDQLHAYETRQILQVRPQSVKVGKKATFPHDRQFALLMRAMKESGTFALVRYTMRGKLHIAGITHDGTMRDFYWQNEIREERNLPDVELTSKEAGLAVMLVEQLTEETLPALENTAVQSVNDFVAKKAAGEAPETARETNPAPAEIDLETLLAMSLEVSHNIYNAGRVHVMREKCSTCIFRPGNLMHLEEGRVRDMWVETRKEDGSTIVCHDTLGTEQNAVCRGWLDSRAGKEDKLMQMASAMRIIEEIEEPS